MLGIPLGLGVHLVVDTVPYVIPMAAEEPSVIAALSNGAKTLSLYGGGVYTEGHEKRIVEGTIRFINVPDEDWAERTLLDNKEAWICRANEFCLSMIKHGGGVLDIAVRRFNGHSGKRYFIVTIAIDVCQAMGSNCTDSVVEKLAPLLQQTLGGEILMAIVSNLSLQCVVRAKFKIPTRYLSYGGIDGYLIAQRIVDANQWADDDIFRAVTHNKGIMNGIDALALATGQDWRVIEASVHAYQMTTKGYYGSLTTYTIQSSEYDDKSPYLEGSIELPMIVGTQGGVFSSNPSYVYAMRLLNYPDSTQLAKVSFRCGLSMNHDGMSEDIPTYYHYDSCSSINSIYYLYCLDYGLSRSSSKLCRSSSLGIGGSSEWAYVYARERHRKRCRDTFICHFRNCYLFEIGPPHQQRGRNHLSRCS